jgi:hypothetical protein
MNGLNNLKRNKAMTHDQLNDFNEWLYSDNVVQINGKYSTQDALYRNRLTLKELKAYFIREFRP